MTSEDVFFLNWIKFGRVVLSLFLTYYFYRLVFAHVLTPSAGRGNDWLSSINLLIHEAGHFIFEPVQIAIPIETSLAGMMIYIFAGSFMQWFVPSLFTGYFIWKKQFFSAFFILFWVGESVLDSVNYIADAQLMRLPLLSDGLIHDWHYLLLHLGVLQYTPQIALGFQLVAICILTISLLGCWIGSFYVLYSDAN